MAFMFAVCLLLSLPPTAVYAEGGDGEYTPATWCQICNKPFPCGFYETDPVNIGTFYTHEDMGDGTVDRCATSPISSEFDDDTIDTGGASIGGGQSQGGDDAFSSVDGTKSSGTGGSGDDTLPDQRTPIGEPTGLMAGFTGLMGDTFLDEDGAVKTWAKAAGVIIIALIALGVTVNAMRRAKKRRSRQARL